MMGLPAPRGAFWSLPFVCITIGLYAVTAGFVLIAPVLAVVTGLGSIAALIAAAAKEVRS